MVWNVLKNIFSQGPQLNLLTPQLCAKTEPPSQVAEGQGQSFWQLCCGSEDIGVSSRQPCKYNSSLNTASIGTVGSLQGMIAETQF